MLATPAGLASEPDTPQAERGIGDHQVSLTLREPDDDYPSKKKPGRRVAEKRLATGKALRMVYVVEDGVHVMITVIAMSRKRRVPK